MKLLSICLFVVFLFFQATLGLNFGNAEIRDTDSFGKFGGLRSEGLSGPGHPGGRGGRGGPGGPGGPRGPPPPLNATASSA